MKAFSYKCMITIENINFTKKLGQHVIMVGVTNVEKGSTRALFVFLVYQIQLPFFLQNNQASKSVFLPLKRSTVENAEVEIEISLVLGFYSNVLILESEVLPCSDSEDTATQWQTQSMGMFDDSMKNYYISQTNVLTE